MVTFVVGLTQFMTQEVNGSLEANLTYFLTPKVNLTFDLDLDQGSSIWPDRWPQMSK